MVTVVPRVHHTVFSHGTFLLENILYLLVVSFPFLRIFGTTFVCQVVVDSGILPRLVTLLGFQEVRVVVCSMCDIMI